MRCQTWLLWGIVSLGIVDRLQAEDWPQFRGAHFGRAVEGHPLPDAIGPNQNVLWKTPVPLGHSSPIVVGSRIFLTGVREQKLYVFALDRNTGKLLWEDHCPAKQLEPVHAVGNPAQSTSASDGKYVVSFFGSCGLFCHTVEGQRVWHRPFGPFPNEFGAGSSPILVDDRVILAQDHDNGSFIMMFRLADGETVWKTDRSEFLRNYSTPVIWQVQRKKQIVLAGTLRVVGYDFDTGKELWTVRGIARIVNMTPSVGEDGLLYVPAWSPGGEDSDRFEVPAWEPTLQQYDKNQNGTLEEDELPKGPIKERFGLMDRNKDKKLDRAEWTGMQMLMRESKNVFMVIRPGGVGDITKTHVGWRQTKLLPYVPSPVVYRDQIFMVRNGGIFTALDRKTGQPTRSDRIYGSSSYYASPVAGDGKIYTISERGHVNVLSAKADWEPLSQGKFDEDVFATPAIANGKIYVRTTGHLYCFGRMP